MLVPRTVTELLAGALDVAVVAPQDALERFRDQGIPSDIEHRGDRSFLRLAIKVVELKPVDRSAVDANASKHLDQLAPAPLSAGRHVIAHVLVVRRLS